MTEFKCGGLALGLSWAHILGDPLSLSHLFNLWTQAFAGEKIHSLKLYVPETEFPNSVVTCKEPDSIKRVDPVGDLWVVPNNNEMITYSFHLKIHDILRSFFPLNGDEFEILSAIMWKCIAKTRIESEPRTITIIRSDHNGSKHRSSVSNSQMISSVHVDFSVADANLKEIVKAIRTTTDERSAINATGESDGSVLDFIVYGAKLTFVDLSEVDFYQAKIRETMPKAVYCNVKGIGESGTVVVLRATKEEERVVTVTLEKNEIEKVKSEFKKCGLMITSNGE